LFCIKYHGSALRTIWRPCNHSKWPSWQSLRFFRRKFSMCTRSWWHN